MRSCEDQDAPITWYEAMGPDGLVTGTAPGPAPRLSEEQLLVALIEDGPEAAGYTSGVWTGPMIGDLIAQRFGVRYYNRISVTPPLQLEVPHLR